LLAVVLASGTTAATARATSTIASYCSPSGDICYGVFERGTRITLQITTAAHYFNRYTLCVTLLPQGHLPEHARRCGAFPVFRQAGSTWGSSIDLARQYVGPRRHGLTPVRGRYQVTWRQVCRQCAPKARRHSARGTPLGPSLYFRVP
jgi:hypothetical protein